MSTMCQADGLSRNEIRLIAKRLRKIFNIKGYCFPIVKFLDVVLPTIEEIPFYINPEWQANTFAAELLVPMDLVKNMSANDIVKNCKVSWQCAKIQVENFKK